MSSKIAPPLAESSGQGPSGSGEMPPPPARKRYRRAELDRDAAGLWDDEEEGSQKEMEEEYIPIRQRRAREAEELQARLSQRAPAPETDDPTASETSAVPPEPAPAASWRPKESLLAQKARALQDAPPENDQAKILEEEASLMQAVTQRQALKTYAELAKGVEYARGVSTGWAPPLSYRLTPEAEHQSVRDQFFIVCEGRALPPPIPKFEDMRLPRAITESLQAQGIARPTPIQMQGLPVVLSGRDMIGIAFTGSGKTLVFTLPLVMAALQEEVRMPLAGGEGPVGVIVCPSRELAKQTHDILAGLADALRSSGEPELRTLLAIGGADARAQADAVRAGVHGAVATPGRLKDLLGRRRMTADQCRYLCFDEADRMVDMGFEEDVREILSFFRGQRQTLMFSATMPAKIRSFANSALIDPVVVNVGRAGATNLDIVQEVEYVKEEAKLPAVLDALQKTAPPVLVFAENKRDVDRVHEYLLLKGVEAVATHGSKDQEEREWAVEAFKQGRKDVLVATDVASKGLDFDHVQHVINYDMPEEIENYVHRIGRTGRRGRTGVATTFVNKSQSESVLLDLKHLLQEAKQRVPPVLLSLNDPMDELRELEAASGTRGCVYCGGLGHRIADCPKLRGDTREQERKRRDHFGSGGFGAEM